MKFGLWRLWLAALTVVALTVVGVAVAFADQGWKIEPTPNPTDPSGFNLRTLSGVSCTSATACWAVGYTGFIRTLETTIVEFWNGSSWTVVPVPASSGAKGRAAKSVLDGISCPSQTDCMAVGYEGGAAALFPFSESWNGTNWTIEPMANPGRQYSLLYGVSCTAATACMAVGLTTNGSYGNSARLVAESWNGHVWKITRVPQPAGSYAQLQQVSCASARMCVAVGSYFTSRTSGSLAELWNGHTWTIQALPTTSDINAVSCIGARSCVAVGSNASEFWDGHKWTMRTLPKPSGATYASLDGVYCTSSRACVAVGTSTNPSALVALWNGRKWSVQQLPKASGMKTAGLEGVSCTSSKACVAVGSSSASQNSSVTLAEHY